ncbi:CLUMA_CG018128, isoform A [Clunio marinus]|uniref:Protein CASC3 n=1 Tax=Clunio marinus TaxID=568069 RepID=A0A1J1IZR7_9DIPT|nr:CLUMA_CG018128, isoform A [Clunio marinus]
MTDVVNKSSADESEEKQRTLSLTENSPTSAGVESEYDTASTNSRSDNEQDEYEDDEEDSLDDEATDEEGDMIDDERESGDGQEEQESESGTKKKVDHDEDRSNPQYIPKKGTFYEHDDRTVEDLDSVEQQENPENPTNSNEALSTSSKILSTQNQKVTPKQVKKTKDTDRWTHDRFNENEQAPKSRAELVSAYGYDIRNEDCAPRPRRQRRYGRHQSKYSRNWEDEEAYRKTQAMKPASTRRPLRPEDFPALGATKTSSKTRRIRRTSRPQDENDPQSSSNYRSPVRNREQRSRDDRGSREPRNQRYNNDTSSNNNNARHVKGKKNINFNHNIEYKNQNRKNINYESNNPKNNNVLNQQMQTSSSSQQGQSTSSSAHQHHQQSRYNNETPVSSMSFINSKMNNAANNSNAQASGSSRTILNFDNSSGNYGRGSREKEVNNQHQMHQQQMSNQSSAISPNKNLQYTDHQVDQMKLMEKSYQQQQGKTTNVNLNQVAGNSGQHPSMNNMQDSQMMNNSEMTRSKRYSTSRQRSNVNEAQSQAYHQQQQQQQQYMQQEIEPSHVQNVMPTQQVPSATMMNPQTVPQTSNPGSNVHQQQQQQQQQQQTQKYQAAYYPTNPASEYAAAAAQQAAMMNAMVEKYQYQQQPTPSQYLPPQQSQQIYMPPQTQPTPQQQQLLNYVSTIQPQAPAAAPAYPQYTNYQNYNIQPPTATPTPPQPSPATQPPPTAQQPIYQTQSGLTYYPNAQIAPTHPQRIIQPPQRRPNPIPILAPRDHKKIQSAGGAGTDDSDKNIESEKGASGAENIDHILDNMFVKRQPYEPTISLKDPQTASVSNDDKPEDQISDGMNTMSMSDDKAEGK